MGLFYLRRQFCRERFPPERDGGVWEIQRNGAQAEERAGMNLISFAIIHPLFRTLRSTT